MLSGQRKHVSAPKRGRETFPCSFCFSVDQQCRSAVGRSYICKKVVFQLVAQRAWELVLLFTKRSPYDILFSLYMPDALFSSCFPWEECCFASTWTELSPSCIISLKSVPSLSCWLVVWKANFYEIWMLTLPPEVVVTAQNVPMTIWCCISFLWNLPLPMFLQAGKEENTSLAKKGRRNPSSPEVGRWYGPHEWDGHAACVFINSLRRSSVARLLPLPSCRNAILGRQGAASYILHSVNIRKMRETSKMSELRSCYVWISTLDFGK